MLKEFEYLFLAAEMKWVSATLKSKLRTRKFFNVGPREVLISTNFLDHGNY